MSSAPNNRRLLARRQTIVSLASMPLATVPVAEPTQARGVVARTPAQTLGPFYPRSASERPRDTDPDLLVVEDGRVLTEGVPLYLTGRVVAGNGAGLDRALIEIWQCDARARYHHPGGGDPAERDPYFQGYGATRTDSAGVFHFRTIRPVPYPGRTAHIHVRIQSATMGSLATQLYLSHEPGNEADVIYRHLGAAERARVALDIESTRSDHPLAAGTREMASVELVLA